MKHQITTSTSLIKMLGEKLYSNKLDFILIRELLQNSVDASTDNTRIIINTHWDRDTFCIEVDDLGCGMDEHILLDIFLSIGGSHKRDESIGGFGIAKVALFAASEWAVHSLDNFIDHTLEHKKVERRIGTKVTAKIEFGTDNPIYSWQKAQCERLVYSTAYPNIIYNDDKVEPYNSTKTLERNTTIGDTEYIFGISDHSIKQRYSYENNEFGYVFYRIRGLTQFLAYGNNELAQAQRNLIIDFDNIGYKPTENSYPFSLSREAITDHQVADFVKKWLNDLAKDTQSKIMDAEQNKELRTQWINPRTGLICRSADGILYKPNTKHRRVANIWKQVILTMDDNPDYTFAVTNEPKTRAFFQDAYGSSIFGINPQTLLDDLWGSINRKDTEAILMYFWYLATHEMSHKRFDCHDENFTIWQTQVAINTIAKIAQNSHELKRLIRKLF